MSWKALNWASTQTCRTSSEKFVLIMLANHADEQLTCYPGVELLMIETQLGESTVRRCLSNLAVDGRIRILQRWGRRGSRRSSRYQLLVDGPDSPMPDHDDWKRVYEYTPDTDDDAETDPEPEEGSIPPAAGGISDQGFNTSQSERSVSGPPGSGGTYLSEREVTKKKEVVIPKENPHPPTPQTDTTASEATQGPRRGEDLPFDEETRTALNECVDRVHAKRPGWSTRSIGAAMRKALHEGRAPGVVIAAMLAVANDSTSRVPGRLNSEREWWSLPPVRIGADKPAERCRKHRTSGLVCVPCAGDVRACFLCPNSARSCNHSEVEIEKAREEYYARRRRQERVVVEPGAAERAKRAWKSGGAA